LTHGELNRSSAKTALAIVPASCKPKPVRFSMHVHCDVGMLISNILYSEHTLHEVLPVIPPPGWAMAVFYKVRNATSQC